MAARQDFAEMEKLGDLLFKQTRLALFVDIDKATNAVVRQFAARGGAKSFGFVHTVGDFVLQRIRALPDAFAKAYIRPMAEGLGGVSNDGASWLKSKREQIWHNLGADIRGLTSRLCQSSGLSAAEVNPKVQEVDQEFRELGNRTDELVEIEQLETQRRQKEMAVRNLRDPYPSDLSGIQAEINYWAVRQGEGDPGSPHEVGVANRLEHLRECERRIAQAPTGTSGRMQAPSLRLSPGDRCRKVWVVHGRNERLRAALFAFLRAMHLEPIEFTEARQKTGKPMPTVGEIIETAFTHAQAVVVLLSGDDEARLRSDLLAESDQEHERILTPQARANVLFEAGMSFVSHPTATILVEVGRLRPFSDVAGRHVLKMDNSAAKRKDLADRLKDAGCCLSTAGSDWLSEGDFTPLQSEVPQSASPEGKSAASVDRALQSSETEILINAAENGEIAKNSSEQTGPWVFAGKTHFVRQDDPAYAARYVDALDALISKRLAIWDVDDLYKLTSAGLNLRRKLLDSNDGRTSDAAAEPGVIRQRRLLRPLIGIRRLPIPGGAVGNERLYCVEMKIRNDGDEDATDFRLDAFVPADLIDGSGYTTRMTNGTIQEGFAGFQVTNAFHKIQHVYPDSETQIVLSFNLATREPNPELSQKTVKAIVYSGNMRPQESVKTIGELVSSFG